ncbi:MAG: cytochrome c3 family protein [Deltaproteobacteria bacterium]|nr:MAG: cytochrome c3 family protein [Deltaproteobacteria bacterium]
MKADWARGPARAQTTPLALTVVLALVTACVAVWAPPEPTGYHRTAEIPDPDGELELVGSEECLVCHDEDESWTPRPVNHQDCESCHGMGSIHAESEEAPDIRFPASGDCLGCHESGRATHMSWSTGEHERAGVICSDCHNVHNREPLYVREVQRVAFRRMDPGSALCSKCHLDVASRLNFPSHHPVGEGMLSCTDCHAPHGDRRVALGDRTRLCSNCHQDHMGPWIFEHAPVAEDCMACHNPHGSASYDLLDTSQPALCLSCHTVASFHSTAASAGALFYTRCTDCHGAIHGSYENSPLLQ